MAREWELSLAVRAAGCVYGMCTDRNRWITWVGFNELRHAVLLRTLCMIIECPIMPGRVMMYEAITRHARRTARWQLAHLNFLRVKPLTKGTTGKSDLPQ